MSHKLSLYVVYALRNININLTVKLMRTFGDYL